MISERAFIEALKALATDPAARGLEDDCAVLDDLVITHDMIAQGVHFLPDADPADVAWRLVAVNLSDLAAAGATPLGVMMGYSLSADDAWDRAFVEGLGEALAAFEVPLLGGDTVRQGEGSARTFGLTAFGRAPEKGAPSRKGAKPGHALWVTGVIGDAGAGLALARQGASEPATLLAAYNRPWPLLAEGKALAAQVHAMMDISDGVLIDARRMAAASGVGITLALDMVPLSDPFIALHGDGQEVRLMAATSGDDYQLLFALPDGMEPCVPATCIGICGEGEGLSISFAGELIPLPASLGYEH